MSIFRLQAPDIPLLLSGDGALVTDLLRDQDAPLEASDEPFAALEFEPEDLSKDMQLGESTSVRLGVGAQTSVALSAVWPETAAANTELLEQLGLTGFFGNGGGDKLVMLLQVGGALEANLGAEFKYSVLEAAASLEAGADGRFMASRAYPLDKPALEIVKDFFREVRLPAAVETAPEPGQSFVLDYGGYLKFGASVQMGYEMAGSASHKISELSLSERFELDLFAKVGVSAEVAGRFHVLVGQGSRDGWSRVKVRKHRGKSVGIAADVSVGLDFEVEGLPDSKDKFLGSLLGVRGQSWLNMFADVQKLTDFQQLDAHLDTLAKKYIEEFTGHAFGKLAESDTFTALIDQVNDVLASYKDVENRAIAIFDRYYDPIDEALEGAVTEALDFIDGLGSIEELAEGILTERVSDVLFLITDGDPLGWLGKRVEIAGEALDTLEEIKRRIGQVRSLVTDAAHAKIREVIALAKSKFPLNDMLTELGQIDPAKLRQQANDRLGGFAERFIGRSIDSLSNSELGKAVTEIHETLDNLDELTDEVYSKVRSALDQSLQLKLHGSYNRARESEDLIDLEINLSEPEGRRLMRRAGIGDFGAALSSADPGLVRINSGVLTDRFTRERKVAFNVVGWHDGWHFGSLRSLATRSEQHIRADEGLVTISTELELEMDRKRDRNGEKIFTNFLLGVIGHTTGAANFDEETGRYLVDTIERMSARYSLGFEDPDTKPNELFRYLSFADDFGLVESDASARAAIESLLPRDDDGHFGWTRVSYEVRFSEAGLKAALGGAFDEAAARRTMREIVLANYLPHRQLEDVGWAYWTPSVHALYRQLGPPSFTGASRRHVTPHASPFREVTSPDSVTLKDHELFLLRTLYEIEESVVDGIRTLSELVASQAGHSPREYSKALKSFGVALEKYDKFDEGDNTIFAVLDGLAAAAGQEIVRNSALTITSRVGDAEVKKMLVA